MLYLPALIRCNFRYLIPPDVFEYDTGQLNADERCFRLESQKWLKMHGPEWALVFAWRWTGVG